MGRFRHLTRQRYLMRLFLLGLIPPLLVATLSLFLYQRYAHRYDEELRHGYATSLKSTGDALDTAIHEVYQTSQMLAISEDFQNIMRSPKVYAIPNFSRIPRITGSLSRLRATRGLIFNAFFLSREESFVLDSEGSHATAAFFLRINHFTTHTSEDFLRADFPLIPYRVLAADSLIGSGVAEPRTVLPMLVPGMDYLRGRGLLVINLDEMQVRSVLTRSLPTQGTRMYMLDRDGNIQSATNPQTIGGPFPHAGVREWAKDRKVGVQSAVLDGEPCILFHYASQTGQLRSFSYLAAVPVADLRAMADPVRTIGTLFTLISFGVSFLYAFASSRKAYHPIQNLLGHFHQADTKENLDEFTRLQHGIQGLVDRNRSLEDHIRQALPIVCERYLDSLLTNRDVSISQETLLLLDANGVRFPNAGFRVAVLQIRFTVKYKEQHTSQDEWVLRSKLALTARDLFPESCHCQSLTLDEEHFALVLNPPDDLSSPLVKHLQEFRALLLADVDLVAVQMGLSRFGSGAVDLPDLLEEARTAATGAAFGSDGLLLSGGQDDTLLRPNQRIGDRTTLLPHLQENKLRNLLLSGQARAVSDLLDTLFAWHRSHLLPEAGWAQLRDSLMEVADSVREESVPEADLLPWQDAPAEVHLAQVTQRLTEVAEQRASLRSSRFPASRILDHLKDHFSEDLYLDGLSTLFGLSPQYINRLIREASGQSFHQHLTELRLRKARTMLIETKEGIDMIATHCGFNNRHTFLRTFQRHEGVTPTAYREMNG